VHSYSDNRIFEKECVSLAVAGYETHLIAPNAPEGNINGVNLHGVLVNKKGRFSRVTNTVLKVYRKALEVDAELYHIHDPELIPVALWLKRKGKKIIYDVHEDYPQQNLYKDWIPLYLRYPVSWAMSLVEWIAARCFFSAIVAATPKIAERFPKSKTVTVQNFPLLQEFAVDSQTPYDARPLNVLYVGSIAKVRGVVENITAFNYVRHENCRLVLAGSFESESLLSECKKLQSWKNVDHLGWVDRDQLKLIFSSARIGLVLIHPIKNYLESYPVKLFEYMSAGLPVIASDFPLWRQIIDGAKCGILVNPGKPKEIAKAVDWLCDNPKEAMEMGENGRRAVVDLFNWENEEKKLLNLYEKLTQRGQRVS
jgi:glycosyltransferase involved in cell wall biosynthesis